MQQLALPLVPTPRVRFAVDLCVLFYSGDALHPQCCEAFSAPVVQGVCLIFGRKQSLLMSCTVAVCSAMLKVYLCPWLQAGRIDQVVYASVIH